MTAVNLIVGWNGLPLFYDCPKGKIDHQYNISFPMFFLCLISLCCINLFSIFRHENISKRDCRFCPHGASTYLEIVIPIGLERVFVLDREKSLTRVGIKSLGQ